MFLASQKKEEENLKKAGLVLEKIREIRDVGKRRLWSESYLDWVKDNWSSRGQKLNFIERKYLVQIYQDQSQEIVLKKSAQSGGTERMVTEAVWLADQRPKNSLYLFPTSATMADLVQERVDTPLNASPYLRDIAARGKKLLVKYKYADNVGLKRMTKGFIYFRGSNSLSMITSIAADAIFVDELDRMETDNVPLFEKRLLNSDMKWKRWASTPTVSGFGIDKRWEESDQHYYYVKCNHCNEWQTLSFFENVEELSAPDGIDPDGLLVCRRCRKHIVPWLLEGKWEATKVSSVRGYFLNQLCSPQLDLKNMIKASKRTSQSEIQQFYNQDLGLTYEPKGASLTEADLKACIRGYKLGEREDDEFVGIDVGKFFHVIKLGRERLLDVQEFTDKDELINYLNGCNLKGMVIDALPETRISQEVVKAFEGRAHYSYYSGIKPTKVNEWWQIKDDKVVTDRTLSLDELYSRIKTQKMHLPNNIFEKKDFVAHYKSTTRVVTKEEGDKTRVDYKEVGPDHYLHASNYANMARDIFEQNGAEPFILVV